MEKKCPDVIDYMLEDHESLKSVLSRLMSHDLDVSRKRTIFKRFFPLFQAHKYAEEQTVLEQGLQDDELRLKALEGLEEHEMLEVMVERMRLAVDDEQWLARLKVFCESLEHHLKEEEEKAFPAMEATFSLKIREKMGLRYLEIRNWHQLGPVVDLPTIANNALERVG